MQNPAFIAYHGTDVATAQVLLAGARLDIDAMRRGKIDGAGAFYLATAFDDAVFFALRRVTGAVLRISMSSTAVAELQRLGMVRRPIPRSGRSPKFGGDELFIPPGAFQGFDDLRTSGEIELEPT